MLALTKLLRCRRGNAALVGAATVPLLFCSTALAYDTVQLGLWTHQLQALADSGAVAGARALSQRQPVEPAVERSVARDPRVSLAAAPQVEQAPPDDPRAIRVVLTSQRELALLGAFLAEPPTRSAEATATLIPRPAGDRRGPVQLVARD